MVKLTDHGMYLVDGKPVEHADLAPAEARKNTIAYSILQSHNVSGDEQKLNIRFDAMLSHDNLRR